MKKNNNFNSVNKTLYIPLYGKAYVSQKGLFLQDETAQDIWQKQAFKLRGKAKSKWLAYYMGIRSATFDEWLKQKLLNYPNAIVLHLGCGLDSRVKRVNTTNKWFDVDFLQVINERKKYYTESQTYKMVAGDLNSSEWLNLLPQNADVVVAIEGVSMYLTPNNLRALTSAIANRFNKVFMLMDCYSELAAKLSKVKNPINQVGVSKVYGLDDPTKLNDGEFVFCVEQDITPQKYIEQLKGFEKAVFQKLYAGKFSKKLYKLYEFKK